MHILQALNWRYAVRKFSDAVLTEQQVDELLEATRLSASSYGLQPYRILVVKSKALRRQLLTYSHGQDKVLHSSHLLIIASKTSADKAFIRQHVQRVALARAVHNRDLADMSAFLQRSFVDVSDQQFAQFAEQQAYVALGNLLTSAASMQIDTCAITGIDVPGFDGLLGLAEKDLTTTVICPIGIRHWDDCRARADKTRVSLAEMIIRL
ncbi:MAG: nitroreductase family protein [Pseudomonadales bacterium]|nr:nitroreductase family protein [Pseudomonadales bacterium]